jgi:hypothetical protein
MERRFTWVAGLSVVLIGIAVGVLSYNAGVEHGFAIAAASADLPARSLPPYMWYRPWSFGLGPLGLIFFCFILFRVFFWGGGRGGWRHARYGGPGAFEEWHRQAHERMNQQSPAQPHGVA